MEQVYVRIFLDNLRKPVKFVTNEDLCFASLSVYNNIGIVWGTGTIVDIGCCRALWVEFKTNSWAHTSDFVLAVDAIAYSQIGENYF